MFDLDGKTIEGATVAIAGSFASAKDGYDNIGNYSNDSYPYDNFVYMVASHNDRS